MNEYDSWQEIAKAHGHSDLQIKEMEEAINARREDEEDDEWGYINEEDNALSD